MLENDGTIYMLRVCTLHTATQKTVFTTWFEPPSPKEEEEEAGEVT